MSCPESLDACCLELLCGELIRAYLSFWHVKKAVTDHARVVCSSAQAERCQVGRPQHDIKQQLQSNTDLG